MSVAFIFVFLCYVRTVFSFSGQLAGKISTKPLNVGIARIVNLMYKEKSICIGKVKDQLSYYVYLL